ncbi:MAG: hypothetical protein K2H16_08200 [Prevotella sp.]|nr:hypothetical protein [Prevotella sp.]MDE6152300.1 hypothetical protein [Prevotella sp.]
MVDFLRENTWCSPEQYKWELTIAQVRLMSYDFTHIEYLDDAKVSKGGSTMTVNSIDDLKNMTDLGIPMISRPNT